MPDKAESRAISQFHSQTVTDDHGRYEFAGLVVGSRCTVSAPSSRDLSSGGGPSTTLDFTVPDTTPVALKDLVIAPAPPAVSPRVRRAPGR
jgi:hypothetical protein